MTPTPADKPLVLAQNDLDALAALSLKGYRFLTCRHLAMLHYPSQAACRQRMAEFCRAGLVTRLFLPTTKGERGEAIYTLAPSGARALARLRGISPLGLASSRRPSYLFLEHALRVSQFMCSLEAALRRRGLLLLSWRSERQLKAAGGTALRVRHPGRPEERIPVVPDGLFSLEADGRTEHFFLEADRGTMSLLALGKKMLGYIQVYRRGLHRTFFGVPHFRVLLVTTTAYREDRLRALLRGIGYCPNMFWFATWGDIDPETVLGPIWLKCRGEVRHSLLE